ncbi:MAG: DMT family transporter [Limnohabitans sp.]|nr:DMT family transporter [Limnohabitans sp.]
MATTSSQNITGKDLLMILIVTLSWGMNYPIMKYVVTYFPPVSFRALTFMFGCVSLGIYVWHARESLYVPPHERWLTFKLSLGNMVLWHLGLVFGLTLLKSGRTAIIGYTMPVWALLASVIFFKASFNWRTSLGVALSLSATYFLAREEMSHFAGQPLGLAVTLGAAIAWGTGNAMMKHVKLSISSINLTFWMLLSGMLIFSLIALVFERRDWRWPHVLEWLAVLYGGVVTFAISYVAWFRVARKLTPVTSGLSIMLVPVVGLMGGAWMLGERIAQSDVYALGLILLAMAVVLMPTPQKAT